MAGTIATAGTVHWWWSPEGLPQAGCELLARDVSIPDADHAVAGSLQECRTSGIVGLSVATVVRVALELCDEALAGAVEVHDETVQDVLPAELQAKDAPIP